MNLENSKFFSDIARKISQIERTVNHNRVAGTTNPYWLGGRLCLPVASTNITDATNATPIVITSASHGVQNGERVRIQNVTGNTNANGYWTAQNVAANTLELIDYTGNSTGNAAYSAGGTVKRILPFTQLSITNATEVYLAPLSSYPVPFEELVIGATQARTCTTLNGIPVVAVDDTSQLAVGMNVTGAGIAANSVISTIDTATQITMDKNGTAGATVTLTFTVPINTMVDVFGYNDQLYQFLWATSGYGTSTRTYAITQRGGIMVMAANIGYTYLGSYMTGATAGQVNDNTTRRQVWNMYNQKLKYLVVYPGYNNNNATTTVNTSVAGYKEIVANGSIIYWINGIPQEAEIYGTTEIQSQTANGITTVGLAIDTLAQPTKLIGLVAFTIASIVRSIMSGTLPVTLAEGAHYGAMVEATTGTASLVYADYGRFGGEAADTPVTSLSGDVTV